MKSFLKKYEVLVVAVLTLLFVYAIVFFNQKLNFILGNGLIVDLDTSQRFFTLHYGESKKIDFNVSIENVAYCRASCYYKFIDRSRNVLADNGSFQIGIGRKYSKSYNLTVKRLGSGQDLYGFEVSCRSRKSILCLTKGDEKSRSVLITANYDLTESEKELKNLLKQNVSRFLELLSSVDISHQKLSQKYFQLGHKISLGNVTPLKIDVDGSYDELALHAENLRSTWATEDYSTLRKLFNSSYFDDLGRLNKSIYSLDKRINKIAETHNLFLEQLDYLHQEAEKLTKFAIALDDEEILYDTFTNTRLIEKAAASITNNTFEDYRMINESILAVSGGQEEIKTKSFDSSLRFFVEFEYRLKAKKDLLCTLNNNCNSSMRDLALKAEQFKKYYPEPGHLGKSCGLLDEINIQYENSRNEALPDIQAKNKAFPENESFRNLSMEFLQNELRKLNNSYLESYGELLADRQRDTGILAMISEFLPVENVNLAPLEYDASLNLSLYWLSRLNISKDMMDFERRCRFVNFSLANLSLEPVSLPVNYTITNRINTNLSDNLPVCCVFNDCGPCCAGDSCRQDPSSFPVIFVHGHSFAKDNSPEFSLDAFNSMQDRLQEDGYLSAGIVSLYTAEEPTEYGIWSLSGRPITVKVSYYYDAFRKENKYIVVPTKSESIDTYALRLKDIIEIVKQRTNKPKVNIIAHSMGGLVARRYIQVFGDSDVDRLIMIATPNHGITGSAINYCLIAGENKECQDMMKDSIFINKLNDPKKQPAAAKIYNVIGTGCIMGSRDGDGIVYSEDAKLDNAESYLIRGDCPGFFSEHLHTSILDIEKYPETYRTVREILKK